MQRELLPIALLAHFFQTGSVFLITYALIKRAHPVKYFSPVFLYVVFYFFTDISSTTFALFHTRNVPLAIIYYPVEYVLLSWLFYVMGPRHHKRLIVILGTIALLVFAVTGIFFRGASGHNFVGMTFVHSALLIIAGRFLVWLTAKGQSELKTDPQFYITLGVILDCGVTAMSFILFDTFDYHLPFITNSIADTAASIFVFIGVFFLFKNEMAVLNVLRGAEKETSLTE